MSLEDNGPPRLTEDPRFAELFRAADKSFAAPRDEARDFAALRLKVVDGRSERGTLGLYVRWSFAVVALLIATVSVKKYWVAAPAEVARENVWRPRSPFHAQVAPVRSSLALAPQQPVSEAPGSLAPAQAPSTDAPGVLELPAPAVGMRGAARDAPNTSRELNPGKASPAEAQKPDCLAFAREGRPQEAEACFMQRSSGTGLAAEVSLYEAARLRRDVLGDLPGALQALGLYRSRFPAGSLRSEVDMSYLELLSRTGRDQEALAESGRLLQSIAGNERSVELHTLRGHIFRKGSKDLRAAEREYALAEQGSGPLAREATFLRGTCLQALGELTSAREAFERYLAKGPGAREREIRQRLSKLQP